MTGTRPGVEVPITDPDDPRLALYRDLAGGDHRARFEAAHGVFVAEGPLTVAALLRSPWTPLSVLIDEGQVGRRPAIVAAAARRGVPVLRVAPALITAVAGFAFHRGVLALGRRREQAPLAELCRHARIIGVVEGVNDHENLGALFRNAAAFGVAPIVLDPTTADPLYRRSLRVSVGHVLEVPFGRAEAWPAALVELQRAGFTVVALTPGGDRQLAEVAAALRGHRVATLMGAEGPGLSPAALEAADLRVRIPVAAGVDSLNVATAAALAWYELGEPVVG